MAKIAKNGTKNRLYGPADAARPKIFGPKGILPTTPSLPEKILKIRHFLVPQVVLFAGTLC